MAWPGTTPGHGWAGRTRRCGPRPAWCSPQISARARAIRVPRPLRSSDGPSPGFPEASGAPSSGPGGFFSAEVAKAAIGAGADFAIAAKRNEAAWRAERDVEESSWVKARGMEAEVAECDYRPGGWPEGTRCVLRRVKVDQANHRSDPRSRRLSLSTSVGPTVLTSSGPTGC